MPSFRFGWSKMFHACFGFPLVGDFCCRSPLGLFQISCIPFDFIHLLSCGIATLDLYFTTSRFGLRSRGILSMQNGKSATVDLHDESNPKHRVLFGVCNRLYPLPSTSCRHFWRRRHFRPCRSCSCCCFCFSSICLGAIYGMHYICLFTR